MIGSSLFSPIPFNLGESQIDFISGFFSIKVLELLKNSHFCADMLDTIFYSEFLSHAQSGRFWKNSIQLTSNFSLFHGPYNLLL